MVAPPTSKRWQLEVVVPVEDMADLAANARQGQPASHASDPDEPVRFVGAATPAQAPIHFYDSRAGAASPAGRGASRENKS